MEVVFFLDASRPEIQSCVIAVSDRCKTSWGASQDASKSHCLSSAIDFCMLLEMKGSGILMHVILFRTKTGIRTHKPT